MAEAERERAAAGDAVALLETLVQRLIDAEARARQEQAAPRVRVDIRLDGEAMPAWADKRPNEDFWLLIDLTEERA